jgi:hypothetical protein
MESIGVYSSTGNATNAPIDNSCSGTTRATSLLATNTSFAAVAQNGANGNGGGGSCLLKTQIATLNTAKITASNRAAGTNYGAAASVGRIHLDYFTSYTGTTSPTINVTQDLTLKEASGSRMFLSF